MFQNLEVGEETVQNFGSYLMLTDHSPFVIGIVKDTPKIETLCELTYELTINYLMVLIFGVLSRPKRSKECFCGHK